jgi:hypothetical protein
MPDLSVFIARGGLGGMIAKCPGYAPEQGVGMAECAGVSTNKHE